MQAVLIGGSGFLGSYVKNELLLRGLNCYTAGRSKSNDLQVDILNADSLSTIYLGLKPDIVFNFAGTFSKVLASDLRVNSEGPKFLVDSIMSSSNKPRLIHISSATEPRIKSEEIRFESPYSESKFIGTSAVQLAADKGYIDARIIRVHNCYGKGQPTDRFVSWAAYKLSKQEEISIRYPKRIRDFCLVSEAAQKISEIATSDESSGSIAVEVGTGLGLTLNSVALKICETLNAKSSLVTSLNGDLEDPHPFEVAKTQGNTTGACKIEFHEGIQKTWGVCK